MALPDQEVHQLLDGSFPMTTIQPTLAEGILPLADEVMEKARGRALDEGCELWSPRHYEILREEWVAAYPDVDERSLEALTPEVSTRKAGNPL